MPSAGIVVLFSLIGAAGLPVAADESGATLSADSLVLGINIPASRLDVLRGGRVVHRYRVAVGQPRYPTPVGAFTIERVEANPSWTPPASEWAADAEPMPPGPRNPMGRVKLQFLPLYYIHGTPDSASLGAAASHGCVRMSNGDALALAAALLREAVSGVTADSAAALLANDHRTRVIVLDRPIRLAVYYRPIEANETAVLVHRDVYRRWTDSLENDTRVRLEAALHPRRLPPGFLAQLVGRMRTLPAGASLTIPLDSAAVGRIPAAADAPQNVAAGVAVPSCRHPDQAGASNASSSS